MSTPSPKLIGYYVLKDGNIPDYNSQRDKVLMHTKESKSELVAEFTEQVNNEQRDLRELKKAIEACKTHEAKLAFAAFDDMPRKFRFMTTIIAHGVDCVVIRGQQNSHATRLAELIGEFWR